MSTSCYSVPAAVQQHTIEIKKSRFIAWAAEVGQREQALLFLQQVKLACPDARHYCWAYLLGNPYAASSAAMSDDGEPSGTAGRPILNVIQHKKIGDIMVVVVRYFGGIKLGAGGLTRAYSSATEALLSQLALREFVPKVQKRVYLDFAQENSLRHWAMQQAVVILASDWQLNQLVLLLELPLSLQQDLLAWAAAQRMVVTEVD